MEPHLIWLEQFSKEEQRKKMKFNTVSGLHAAIADCDRFIDHLIEVKRGLYGLLNRIEK